MLEERRGIEAVAEHAGEAAQRLQRAERLVDGALVTRVVGRRFHRSGDLRLVRREKSGEERVEELAPDRLVQHVLDAGEVGVLLPFPLLRAGVNEHGADWREALQFLDGADRAGVGQLDVEDRGIDRAPRKQELGVGHVFLGDELELAHVEHGLDGSGEGRLPGNDEERAHVEKGSERGGAERGHSRILTPPRRRWRRAAGCRAGAGGSGGRGGRWCRAGAGFEW